MTWEQVIEILGPELAEKARAEGRASTAERPLTRAQIDLLVGIFLGAENEAARRGASRLAFDDVA